jgi:hypothetical protein
MSAKSAKSSKTTKSHSKVVGRGHGYFGDKKDVDDEMEKYKKMQENFLVKTEPKTTDATGSLVFYNVPIGRYNLVIEGNH